MRKGMIRIALTALMMMASFGLLSYSHTQAELETESIVLQDSVLQVSSLDGKFGISVTSLLGEGEMIRIDAWENDGRYYLFLPQKNHMKLNILYGSQS